MSHLFTVALYQSYASRLHSRDTEVYYGCFTFEGFYFNFILFLSYFKLLMMKICGKLKQLPSAKTNTHRPPTHFLLCSHFLLFLLRLSMGILRVNFGVKKGLQQHSFAFREEPDLVIPLGISEPGLQRQKRQQGDQKRQQGLQC